MSSLSPIRNEGNTTLSTVEDRLDRLCLDVRHTTAAQHQNIPSSPMRLTSLRLSLHNRGGPLDHLEISRKYQSKRIIEDLEAEKEKRIAKTRAMVRGAMYVNCVRPPCGVYCIADSFELSV
jgi:hypothetical protein